jgi:hypothetical protein
MLDVVELDTQAMRAAQPTRMMRSPVLFDDPRYTAVDYPHVEDQGFPEYNIDDPYRPAGDVLQGPFYQDDEWIQEEPERDQVRRCGARVVNGVGSCSLIRTRRPEGAGSIPDRSNSIFLPSSPGQAVYSHLHGQLSLLPFDGLDMNTSFDCG